MITKTEFVDGVIGFVETHMLPKFQGWQSWSVKAALFTFKLRADAFMDMAMRYAEHPAVKHLGLMDEQGRINIDLLLQVVEGTKASMPNPIWDSGEGTTLTQIIGRIVIEPELIVSLLSSMKKKGAF